MDIAVIFTGGTIGSAVSGQWTSLDDTARFRLIDTFEKHHPHEARFRVRIPYAILSENLTADAINALLDAVEREEQGDADGIIVTHGTDTLQYAAAAIALRFPRPRCPIILVSANYPLDDPRSNGHCHFEAAVRYIRAGAPPLPLAVYRNPDDVPTFHRGDRMFLPTELSEHVLPLSRPVAVANNDRLTIIDAAASDDPPVVDRYPARSRVVLATAVPGMGYPYALDDAKAVLFRPFHSGTLNTVDGELEAFCRAAAARRIPLWIAATGRDADYESVAAFERLGIRFLPPCTLADAYMRLWLGVW